MTSKVQPLNAGNIHAFKVHYRQLFCICALDAHDAGKLNIYKILEAMLMAKKVWAKISQQTIANCWRHTAIDWSPTGTASANLAEVSNEAAVLGQPANVNVAVAAARAEMAHQQVTTRMHGRFSWTSQPVTT